MRSAPGSFTSLLACLALAVCSPHFQLPGVERHEIVKPLLIDSALRTEDRPQSQDAYPAKVSYSMHLQGQEIILHLEKNEGLLVGHYSETRYLENGTEVVDSPRLQDHCYYHGVIEGIAHSSVSVSTCNGIRGILVAGPDVYLIEPLDGAGAGEHAVYGQQHLRMKRATCHSRNLTLYDNGPKVAALYQPPATRSRHPAHLTRYVELFLVVDNAEYKRFNHDMLTIRQRMMEIVNHVDKLYRSLDIRVALVGLEVWTQANKITISSSPDTTLDNFLKWRGKELLWRKKHDNAQLVTGTSFEGTTVGLATKAAMCTFQSGGVNEIQVHLLSPTLEIQVHLLSPTLEIQVHLLPPTLEIQVHLLTPILEIQVHLLTPTLEIQECTNPCCNATTCKLKEGAACWEGECCRNCQFRAAGQMCRAVNHDCDLPDYCDGQSSRCPDDVFAMNGSPCSGGQGYCYNGQCPMHQHQCSALWGPGAAVAPNVCFQQNEIGNKYLYCRATSYGHEACRTKDIKCGKMHCVGGSKFPVTQAKYEVELNHNLLCKVATLTDQRPGVADPGHVATGTKCGHEMVCYDGQCQSLQLYGSLNCSRKCNQHGVCNHQGVCHCDPGWAKPDCAMRKDGLPVSDGVTIIVVCVLVPFIGLLILISGGLLYYKGCLMKKYIKKIPIRSSSCGLTNPIFVDGKGRCGSKAVLPNSRRTPVEHALLAASRKEQPLQITVIPSRQAPPPPKSFVDKTRPPHNAAKSLQHRMVKPSAPPPIPPVKPSLHTTARPPPPPTKPLPELKAKPMVNRVTLPPLPAATPCRPTAVGFKPKVALKPPNLHR
ncbi:disintegrin and metalloproteinase domain-containing protein 8a [Rhinoraja longicauda]